MSVACRRGPAGDKERTRDGLEVGLEALRVLRAQLATDAWAATAQRSELGRTASARAKAADAPPGPRMTMGTLKLPPEV